MAEGLLAEADEGPEYLYVLGVLEHLPGGKTYSRGGWTNTRDVSISLFLPRISQYPTHHLTK